MGKMIQLDSHLLHLLKDLAENSYPKECCGFMSGCLVNLSCKEIHHLCPAKNVNVQRSMDRYEIDPVEFLKYDRECRVNNREILGFFHSHPNSCAVPSDYDGKMAWPGYCYLIIAVNQGGAQELRCWVLEGEAGEFEEEEIGISLASTK